MPCAAPWSAASSRPPRASRARPPPPRRSAARSPPRRPPAAARPQMRVPQGVRSERAGVLMSDFECRLVRRLWLARAATMVNARSIPRVGRVVTAAAACSAVAPSFRRAPADAPARSSTSMVASLASPGGAPAQGGSSSAARRRGAKGSGLGFGVEVRLALSWAAQVAGNPPAPPTLSLKRFDTPRRSIKPSSMCCGGDTCSAVERRLARAVTLVGREFRVVREEILEYCSGTGRARAQDGGTRPASWARAACCRPGAGRGGAVQCRWFDANSPAARRSVADWCRDCAPSAAAPGPAFASPKASRYRRTRSLARARRAEPVRRCPTRSSKAWVRGRSSWGGRAGVSRPWRARRADRRGAWARAADGTPRPASPPRGENARPARPAEAPGGGGG